MEIKHAIHEHPLSFIEKGNEKWECKGCLRYLSGPTYGCKKCAYFYLHESCVDKHKVEIQSYFHPCPLVLSTAIAPACNLCYERIRRGFHYTCKSGCHYSVHVKCALIKPIKESSDEEGSIQHFTHLHPLKPFHSNNHKQVVCAICENPSSSSSSSSSSSTTYGCKECKFFLHKSCMTNMPLQFTNHLIHPCNLIFITTPDYLYRCDKCSEESHFRSLAFHCGKCYFDLHVKCALLPTIDSEDAKEIQHFSHPHPLLLIQNNQGYANQPQPRCVICVEEICFAFTLTPTFRCSRSSCNHFFLHKSCALNLPYKPLEIRHPSHPRHTLAITSFPHNHHIPTCGACYMGFDSSLLAYGCRNENCGFKLHLDCANLMPSIFFDGHREHLLTFFEKTTGFTCHLCGVNCSNFILRCVPCNFNIHLQCHPSAPITINHKRHLHSLTLTRPPFEFELNSKEDAYNSEDEFYCDVCEKKRNKRELVYYCADCKFIAEVKCVDIPSVLSVTQVDCRNRRTSLKDDATDKTKSSREIQNWQIENVKRSLIRLQQKEGVLKEKLQQLSRELDDVQKEIGTKNIVLRTLE